jgi:hypothetical protein
MTLDTAYVGALFRHLQDNRNLNYIPYGAAYLPQNQDPTITSSLPGGAALPAQFMRGMRGIGDINLYEGAATGNYNSLQVQLQRRAGRHVFMGVSYTWSKDLTTASTDTGFVRPDQYTHMAYYGPSANDRRHNFALNYVVNLPTLAGANRFGKTVFGGWQLSGVTVFMSGAPYSIAYSTTGASQQNITGSSTENARVGFSGNPNTGSSSPYNLLNGAMVIAPQVGSIGLESGSNYLTGPGINDFDMSLQKEFSIKERLRLQFRADAFNVFNHTQFGGTTNGGVNNTITFASLTNPTPTNLYLKPDGTVNNINGFGTISISNGVRNPRIMQLVLRLQF